MALTLTKRIPNSLPLGGDSFLWVGRVTFDSSYPTGGEAIAATDFESGADYIDHVFVNAISDVATKHVRWDDVNSKLMIFVEDGTSGISAEAANASDQSAVDTAVAVLYRRRP